jgi:hypothetical protein
LVPRCENVCPQRVVVGEHKPVGLSGLQKLPPRPFKPASQAGSEHIEPLARGLAALRPRIGDILLLQHRHGSDEDIQQEQTTRRTFQASSVRELPPSALGVPVHGRCDEAGRFD